jgi:hypothetical protein
MADPAAPYPDARRRSALAGVAVGGGLVVVGALLFATAARLIEVPDAKIHVPRWILAACGLGVALCGASCAAATLRIVLARALAAAGIALTFVMPLTWVALGPGVRECAATLSFGLFAVQRAAQGWTCRGAFALAALLGLAILVAALGAAVKPWAPAAWRARIERSSEGTAALLAGLALLVILGVASPLLAVRWAAVRAYARLTGSVSRS